MKEIDRLLKAARDGDQLAINELFPVVYEELRRMAAQKVSQEKPGHTLNATALVHEAYIRLLGPDNEESPNWDSRGHFFAAAAEAMRRILVESARRKARHKHGGGRERVGLSTLNVAFTTSAQDVVAINESLDKLAQEDELGAGLVKLRFFAGLSIEEAASVLGLSRATAYRHWKFARAWLQCELD